MAVKKLRKLDNPPRNLKDVDWLRDVREVRHSIDQMHPLLVRDCTVKTGAPLPQPSVPFPEKHPYCELNYIFQGSITQYIGTENIKRESGDIMLIGPGTPHYAIRHSYPQRSVTIHFLPMLLFAMGPEGDGARALARFTSPQNIRDQVVRPPGPVAKRIRRIFEQMIGEFEGKKIGAEFSLRVHFMEILIELLRWDETAGRKARNAVVAIDWTQVVKTLHFIHDHYSEPLYVEQIARAAGLSVSRLQAMFHEAFGMSCVQYLRTYRMSHATAMLCAPDSRVTDVALAVGFETLSHFNTSFRSFLGMSPTEYVRKNRRNRS